MKSPPAQEPVFGDGEFDDEDAADEESLSEFLPFYEPPDNDTALRWDIFRLLLPQHPDIAKLPKAIADIERVIQGKRPRVVGADE